MEGERNVSLVGRKRREQEIATTAMQSLAASIVKTDPESVERLLGSFQAVWSAECELVMANLFADVLRDAIKRRLE